MIFLQVFAFAQSLHPLSADPTEIGLLSAICLICAGKHPCKITVTLHQSCMFVQYGLPSFIPGNSSEILKIFSFSVMLVQQVVSLNSCCCKSHSRYHSIIPN